MSVAERARTDSLFIDAVGGGTTRRGRRLATPGAGVLPSIQTAWFRLYVEVEIMWS